MGAVFRYLHRFLIMKITISLTEIESKIPSVWAFVKQSEFLLAGYQEIPALKTSLLKLAAPAVFSHVEDELKGERTYSSRDELLARYIEIRELMSAAKVLSAGETNLIWGVAIEVLDEYAVQLDLELFQIHAYYLATNQEEPEDL
jgi:hypothetical protein